MNAEKTMKMNSERTIKMVAEMAETYGTGWTVEQVAKKMYFALCDKADCVVINDRYLSVNGNEFQFIRSRSIGHYVAKCYKVAA